MKVKNLIEELKKLDQDKEVGFETILGRQLCFLQIEDHLEEYGGYFILFED